MEYKGLIYHGAKDFTMETCEMPECGENDVILRNVVASVCGSDADTGSTAERCITSPKMWNSATRWHVKCSGWEKT